MDTSQPNPIYLYAVCLPLAAFVINVLIGHRLKRFAAYLATAAIGLAFLFSAVGLYTYSDQHGHRIWTSPAHEAVPEPGPVDEDETAEPGAPSAGRIVTWDDHLDWLNFGGVYHPATNQYTGGLSVRMGYHVDVLTALMFSMITFIATLIHVYSIGYMSHEPRFERFFTYLSLFCFSMLALVVADNVFLVFMCWELVGLCSYFLIGFYYEKRSASNAANKAFVVNRVGDAGMILGLAVIWASFGTFDFETIRHQLRDHQGGLNLVQSPVPGALVAVRDAMDHPVVNPVTGKPLMIAGTRAVFIESPARADEKSEVRLLVAGRRDAFQVYKGKLVFNPVTGEPVMISYALLTAAGLGIFLGCVGKSAQFPLHVWLPDAMEGPTPVSALIHAATMVAAGVYLVGRFYPLFTDPILLVIAYTGGITLFMAATIAVVLTDIKKVLAYSTISQLGYMMLGLGVFGWAAGLFHLLTHAFFKALLFLGAGSVIHACHTNEMPQMGGLGRKMPVTALTMLVATLAIAGTPWFSGYYSKDAIIATAMQFWLGDPWSQTGHAVAGHPKHILLYLLPTIAAGITAFYMFRLWFLTFAGKPRDEHVYDHAHESPRVMTIPLIILAALAMGVAWFGWLENAIGFGSPRELPEPSPGLHALAGAIALGLVGLGMGLAVLLYLTRSLNPAEARDQFRGLFDFVEHKYYFDELYTVIFMRPVVALAGWCRRFDEWVIDGILNGIARLTVWISSWDGRFDFGIIDGLVNLVSDVIYGIGLRVRVVQTGQLRNYIVYLVVAAAGIFAVLSYWLVSSPR